MRYKLLLFLFFALLLPLSSYAALDGRWEESAYDVQVTPGIHEKFLWISNPNDVPVNVTFMPTGGIREKIDILTNPLELQPKEKARMIYKIGIDVPGIYNGQINALFFTPVTKPILIYSPEITIEVIAASVVTETIPEDNIDVMPGEDEEVAAEEEQPSGLSAEIETVDTAQDASSADCAASCNIWKQIDAIRGGRSADPITGTVIFITITLLGLVFLFMMFG